MLEEEDDRVTKRGKTRHLIKQRGEKGYFNNIVKEFSTSKIPRNMRSITFPKFPVSCFESGDSLHYTLLGFSMAALPFFLYL